MHRPKKIIRHTFNTLPKELKVIQIAKSILDETQFGVVCEVYQEKMGVLTEIEFVELFLRPDSLVVIWKQSYSKVSGDYGAEMVMKIEDNQFRVDHTFVF